MAVELGQTEDPRALVPGDPDAVEENLRVLRQRSALFDTVGGDLSKVRVTGWHGTASDAFVDTFAKEPPKWLKASDTLATAATAISAYADTLRWAQSQAAEAIELWRQGVAASEQARDQKVHPGAVFTDPGDAARRQARQLLDRARDQLADAGDTAAAAIGARPTGSALDTLVNAVTGGWTADGKADLTGPRAGFEMSGPKGGKLGELKAYADLVKASAEGSVHNGPIKLTGKAEYAIGGSLTAAAALTDQGFKAKLEAMLGHRASAGYRADLGPLGYESRASGFAGGLAGAGLRVGADAIEGKAEAFAGAKGNVRGAADVGGVGVGATAEGWVGAGVEAKATIGMGEDGKFHLSGKAGAALGYGGSVGFDLQIEPNKVTRTAQEAADVLGKGGQRGQDDQRLVRLTGR